MEIPAAALDDRLGIVGTAGSGKTYGAGTAVERILQRKGRVIIPDPLGVWWGLRLKANGSPSEFDVVIFGGEHGDLPLTEYAGALIGETVASMKESAILDLSQLGTKAAERRFMLAFLTALYRHSNGEPVHLIFDEADMWSPQRLMDKDGDAAKLLGMMETICRRGRIKGFIPWLITQRPAVVNKDVLSQVDGLVAFKLTSSQDRDALSAWVEGQTDKKDWQRIYADLAAKERGHAVIWLPSHGILTNAAFPAKLTFDSSRTPKRGEKRHEAHLKPLDLGSLKERLAKVEAETKANDPKVLRAELASLKRQMVEASTKAAKQGQTPDPQTIADAEQRGYVNGDAAGYQRGVADGYTEATKLFDVAIDRLHDAREKANVRIGDLANNAAAPTTPRRVSIVPRPPKTNGHAAPAAASAPSEGLTGPQTRIVEALAFWSSLGFDQPTRAQVGAAAGYSPSSGGFNNLLGGLRTMGLIDYPAAGVVTLTDAGKELAPPPSSAPVRERLGTVLSNPQAKIVDAIGEGEVISRDELGNRTGYSASSGGFNNLLGSLRSLGIIQYPASGKVMTEPWVYR